MNTNTNLQSYRKWLIRAWIILVPFVLLLSAAHFIGFSHDIMGEENYRLFRNIVLFFTSIWFFATSRYVYLKSKEIDEKAKQ